MSDWLLYGFYIDSEDGRELSSKEALHIWQSRPGELWYDLNGDRRAVTRVDPWLLVGTIAGKSPEAGEASCPHGATRTPSADHD